MWALFTVYYATDGYACALRGFVILKGCVVGIMLYLCRQYCSWVDTYWEVLSGDSTFYDVSTGCERQWP